MGPGGAALVRRRGAGQRVDFPGLPRRFVDLPRGGCRRSPQFGAGGRFPGLPRRFVDLPRGGCRRSPQFGAGGRFPGVAPAIRRFAPRRVPAESPVRSRRPFSRGCPGDSSICPEAAAGGVPSSEQEAVFPGLPRRFVDLPRRHWTKCTVPESLSNSGRKVGRD